MDFSCFGAQPRSLAFMELHYLDRYTMLYCVKSSWYLGFLQQSPLYLYHFSILAKEGAWQDEWRSEHRLNAQQIGDTARQIALRHGVQQCAPDVCREPVRSMVVHALRPAESTSSSEEVSIHDLPFRRRDPQTGQWVPRAMFVCSPWCGSAACRKVILAMNATALRFTQDRASSSRTDSAPRLAKGGGIPPLASHETLAPRLGVTLSTCAHAPCHKIGPGFGKCAHCQYARYCSRECQKAHWEQHRGECADLAAARQRTAIDVQSERQKIKTMLSNPDCVKRLRTC